MSEDMFADAGALPDQLLDGVFVLRKTGEITYANAGFASMLGYSPEEVLSLNFSKDLIRKELEWKALVSLLEQGSPICDYEIVLARKDGTNICASISASTLRSSSGVHMGIAGTARDITARKGIEHELREKAFRADTLHKMASIATTNLDIRMTFAALAKELIKAVDFESISVGIVPEGAKRVEVYVPDSEGGAARRVGIVPFEKSIIQKLTSLRRPLVVDKDAKAVGFTELEVLDRKASSLLSVPLVSRGRMIGSVNLTHSKAARFDHASNETLRMAADLVAGLVDNIGLLVSLENKLKLQNALLQTGIELQKVITTEQIYAAIASHLKEVVLYKDLSFYLVDWQKRLIYPVYAAGDFVDEIMASPGGLDEGVVGSVAKSGEAELVEDVDEDPRAEQVPGAPPTHDSMMALPLVGTGGVIGILELYRPKGSSFTDADLEAGKLFAQQASVALENAMLVRKLQETRKEVEMLNDLMFHDINNFNFATMNYLEFLQGRKDFPNQHKERISKALHLVRQTAQLIHAVKKLTRIGIMDPLEFVSMDVSKVLMKVVSGLQTSFPSKRLSIDLKVPEGTCEVMANALIEELFLNLLSNAVKYDSHDEVEIDVVCDRIIEGGKQWCRVTVADRGPGISDDNKAALFEKYKRLKPHEGVEGTGLGLSICKALADKFRGRIWVEDRVPGKSELGARFCVTFPLAHKTLEWSQHGEQGRPRE